MATITVNSTDDVIAVGDPFLTLREAIALANGDTGTVDPLALSASELAQIAGTLNTANGMADVIAFSIPDATDTAPHVIRLGSPLTVAAGESVMIDGTTEPDFAGSPVVVLDGGGLIAIALQLDADGSEVRGLAIGGATSAGLFVNADDAVISGNLIGLDASGAPLPNGDGDATDAGLLLNGSGIVVGGTSSADRNVISANNGAGVRISGPGSSGNQIVGNLIGTDATGTIALGNGGDGVIIEGGAASNTVGGTSAGRENVIAGNAGNGVRISGAGSEGNLVDRNAIGTDLAGTIALGNTLSGVLIEADAALNTIGGQASQPHNLITNNGQAGVRVDGSNTTGNPILGNRIFSHGGSGIDLTDGGNGGQQAPTILDAEIVAGSPNPSVMLTVQSPPGTNGPFRIELFAAVSNDPEGRVFLGAHTIALGSAEETTTSFPLDPALFPGGVFPSDEFAFPDAPTPADPASLVFNATATDAQGNTSAFTSDDPLASGEGGSVGHPFDPFRVTTTLDTPFPFPFRSLRRAIWNANFLPGRNRITFRIPSGSPPFTILVVAPLPTITDRVVIDGRTQPGYDGTAPVIVLDGSNNVSIGLDLASGAGASSRPASEMLALSVVGFTDFGIRVNDSERNRIALSYVGLLPDGTAFPNGDGESTDAGIVLVGGSSGNTIGGPSSTSGNVISANNAQGVLLTGAGTSANLVAGNLIGTDPAGTLDLGNSLNGVLIEAMATDNTIGGAGRPGSPTGLGNLISGHDLDGIRIGGSGTTGNLVVGNVIGTDLGGTLALPNAQDGIRIELAASDNTVGSSGAGFGNLISGNDQNGVRLTGAGTTGNLVVGNVIGTASDGSTDLGNGQDGVRLEQAASANTVGGGDPTLGNTIGFNTSGVVLSGAGGNRVVGNAIFENSLDGVLIEEAASANTVDGNTITRNVGNGVRITDASTTNNLVVVNRIEANAVEGVRIESRAFGNTIGAGNTISGNARDGVRIIDIGTSANLVLGNAIDGNGGDGVRIGAGAAANTVGGMDSAEGNTVAGNSLAGVVLSGAGTSANLVLGNALERNASDGIRFEMAASANTARGNSISENGRDGARVESRAFANTIGSGNVIGRNTGAGVRITGVGTSANLVLGNRIGTDASGAAARPNGEFGVRIESGASANTVGVGNSIAANAQGGVSVIGAGTSANAIVGNVIGTDPSGSLPLGNAGDGVRIEGGATANTVGAGNTLSANAGDGLRLLGEGTSGNLVSGNAIDANAGDGVGIEGQASANTITDNAIDANAGAGVRIEGQGTSGNRLGGNTITGNAGGGVVIERLASANALDAGNIVSTNHLVGVAIESGASANTIGAGNVVTQNGGPGVRIAGEETSANVLVGSFIGVGPTGATRLGNAGEGVLVVGATGNLIGRADASPNLISSNFGDGVRIEAGASGNVVANNRIGTDPAGTTALGNAGAGVVLSSATGNVVGGIDEPSANLISGNGGDGVRILAGSSNNVVAGNRIGTDASGAMALGNGGSGVLILDAPGNLVGGVGNVLAGNGGFGVIVAGLSSSGNRILGNWIGTNAGGAPGLGNAIGGVTVLDGQANQILSNVVAGNGGIGVSLVRSATATDPRAGSGNAVVGNLIGVSNDDGSPLPNVGIGLQIDGADGNPIVANVISRGIRDAVLLVNGADGNLLADNRIGTDRSGIAGAGNSLSGVLVANSSGNQIVGNQIADNGGFGIALLSSPSNRLERNTVGSASLPNRLDGVVLIDSPGNLLANNTVAGNSGEGVVLRGAGSSGNALLSNRIGPGNLGVGVRIDGAGANSIGTAIGPDPALNALRNEIAGNGGNEVFITGPGAAENVVIDNLIGSRDDPGSGVIVDQGASGTVLSGNVVSGHLGFGIALLDGTRSTRIVGGVIGTTQDGSAALSNALNGVFIQNSAGNTIGGPSAADGVLIAANGQGFAPDLRANVRIAGPGSTGNVVASSTIGTDRAGLNALDPSLASFTSLLRFRANDDPNLEPPRRLDDEIEFRIDLPFDVRVDLRSIGVLIDSGASANVVGSGNLISGNRNGVEIRMASGNAVLDNRIGTDASGTRFDRGTRVEGVSGQVGGPLPLGNGDGVLIVQGSGNVVERNVIGGNLFSGVQLGDLADGNRVADNDIGVDPSSLVPLPNQTGVLIFGGSNNAIEGNRVSSSPTVGVHVINSRTVFGQFVTPEEGGTPVNRETPGAITSGNVISGNSVGVLPGGPETLANLQGVLINDSPRNQILRNTIAGNLQAGLQIFGEHASSNVVRGNTIIDNGRGVRRQGFGIFINQAPGDTQGLLDNTFRGNRDDTGAREQNQGPTVQAIRPQDLDLDGRIETIEVVFNGYIELVSAIEPDNYRIAIGRGSTPLIPVEYDEVARRVILQVPENVQPDARTGRYQLTLVGDGANPLRTVTDGGQVILFDGNFDGATGDNFSRDFVGTRPVEPIIPSGPSRIRPSASGVDGLAAANQIESTLPASRRRRR
ncbi:right-handed parallel beta-helix repeat-containing protein [Tautonia sociabilis]|uniref:Carbohydrate-binding/sugar hydrolysis domain-containing protein n=1 Tax=Tautonia sociabilis TaxID=2080755 RepID=A0A432MFG1_9BACT|nr:right-handed parallel beta-helix repeat-containing protein [Tautonia sociabilis]RUL84674.1 hypothetical protein TsocGM_19830 [Tautonia sociabilis]